MENQVVQKIIRKAVAGEKLTLREVAIIQQLKPAVMVHFK